MTTPLDTPWKQILECYFPQFMAFFFPEAHRAIDWDRGFDFLDGELQQVTRDAETGKRIVDKLVKVYLRNGQENWLLIHVEIQNQKEDEFSQRVYIYSTRLFDKFRRSVASFAVLGDTDGSWRPHSFHQDALGSRHDFSFQIAKLLDYRQNKEFLNANDNPFSIVVQAHLAAQATKGKASQQRRRKRKYSLTTMLYERGWPEQEIIDLYRFIDWVLMLPPELEEAFRQDIATYERGKNMPYISTIERLGEVKGKVELIGFLLSQQMEIISADVVEELKKLPIDQLDQLALDLRSFTNADDLANWITQRNASSRPSNL